MTENKATGGLRLRGVNRQLAAIYRDEKRLKDFKFGFRRAMLAAADFLESWDGQKNRYRLGDILLLKFNQTNRKPRKARAISKGENNG